MDCTNCEREKKLEPVPYIAHEAEMARLEREHIREREQYNKEREQHRRIVAWLCAIIIILVLGLIGMFIYETQFEVVEETTSFEVEQEADGNGVNRFVGGDYYGEAESQIYEDNNEPQT